MSFVKTASRFVIAAIFLIAMIFLFRGTRNETVYWIIFPPVKIIQIIVGLQRPPQGAVELSSLTLGAPITALYWYYVLNILQGSVSKKSKSD